MPRPKNRGPWLAAALLPVGLWALALPLSGRADRFEPQDRVDLVHVDASLLAIRGSSGVVLEVPLEVGERVIELRSSGLMGVASTSKRLLGITAASPDWTELRYRLEERRDGIPRVYVQDRVALVTLPNRVVALTPRLKTWTQTPLSPGEAQIEVLADANLVAVITPRRALGFSAHSGDFAEIKLSPREKIERRSVEDSSITLVTGHRVLVFRTGSDAWTDVPRRKTAR